MKKMGKKAIKKMKAIAEKVRKANSDVDFVTITYYKGNDYNSYDVRIKAGDVVLEETTEMVPR